MVGALVYMHSRYTAARMVEEEKDLESTNATVWLKYVIYKI